MPRKKAKDAGTENEGTPPAQTQVPDPNPEQEEGEGLPEETVTLEGEAALADMADPDERLDLDEGEEEPVVDPAVEETPEKKAEAEEAAAEAAKAEEAEKAKKAAEAEAAAKPPAPVEGEEPETPPAPEAGKPEEPPVVEGEPPGEPAAPQQPDLAAITEEFTKWRTESEDLLAEHHYALTDEQVQQFDEDQVPDSLVQAIPRMMSRVYLDAVTAAMGQITTHLPQLIAMVNERSAQVEREEGVFFEEWPQLVEHRDTVLRMGVAYRQANPQVTAEMFIKEVGASAMVALQIPIEAVGDGTPAKPNGDKKPKPFTPATKGAATSGPPPKEGAFETLSREFEEDETLDVD